MNSKSNFLLKLPLLVYVVLWFFFLYIFFQILNFRAENSGNLFLSGMYFIEFGVHEISHLIVMFSPQLFVAMAGSIGEILFTVLILIATIKARSYFASIFAGLWIMLAMNSVGRYIADASSQLLPLAGPGDNVQHDWHYILTNLNCLESDQFIGGIVCFIGDIIGVCFLFFGIVLMIFKIINMFSKRNENPPL